MTLQACRPRILEGLFLDDNDYKMPTMISGPEDFKQLMHLIERKIIMSYLPSRSNETEIIFRCTWIPSARLRIYKHSETESNESSRPHICTVSVVPREYGTEYCITYRHEASGIADRQDMEIHRTR